MIKYDYKNYLTAWYLVAKLVNKLTSSISTQISYYNFVGPKGEK